MRRKLRNMARAGLPTANAAQLIAQRPAHPRKPGVPRTHSAHAAYRMLGRAMLMRRR